MTLRLPSSLLNYIEAPKPLVEVGTILPRLFQVLSVIEQIAGIEHVPASGNLRAWINACQKMCASAEQHHESKTSATLRGLYEEHQPYVSLRHKPSDPFLKVKHDHLLAHLLIANSACREMEAAGERYESSRKTAFIFARSICRAAHATTLKSLPDTACSSRDYLMHLEELNGSTRLAAFSVFIHYALDRKKAITRDAGDSHRKYPARSISHVDEEPDLFQLQASIASIQMPILSPDKEREIERTGISAGEFVHQTELTQITFDQDRPLEGRRSIEHLYRAKSAHKKIAMSNQQLQSRWPVLSNFEASVVANGIVNTYRNGRDSNIESESRVMIETAALLTIMFWFSIPLSEAINSIAHESQSITPTERFEFVHGQPSYALVKTARPDYKSDYSGYKLLDIATHLQLNSGVGIEQILVDHFIRTGKRHQLFDQTERYYLGLINKFITDINQQYGCRLTIPRIANYMFEAIANAQCSDVTYAMLITGNSSYIGKNPIFYTSATSMTLNNIYRATCKSIAKCARLELSKDKAKKGSISKFTPEDRMHGSRIRPTHDDVATLRVHLSDKIRIEMKQGPIEVHNAMAIYTSGFINFATGYRAVGDASFHPGEIDHDTGTAVISDKDTVDEHHSRLVWIMDECLEQIRHYRSQLKILLEHAALAMPNIYKDLSGELFGSDGDKVRSVPGLFIVRDNKIVSLTPTIYEASFPSSYPYPANAHRHFLRCNLLEMGCPSDVINAFMGHAERGQEPWSAHSSLGSTDYREALKPILTELVVQRCGWRAINPYA